MNHIPNNPYGPQQDKGLSGCAIAAIVLGIVCVVLLVIIVALGALMLPALGRAREAAMQARGSAQARGVAMAVMQYHSANNAMLSPESWEDELVAGAWVTREQLAGWQGSDTAYYFVPQPADGSTLGDQSVVLVYEHPDYLPDGGNIAYADGRAVWIEEPRFSEIINALTLPDGTPYAPHTAVTLSAD